MDGSMETTICRDQLQVQRLFNGKEHRIVHRDPISKGILDGPLKERLIHPMDRDP